MGASRPAARLLGEDRSRRRVYALSGVGFVLAFAAQAILTQLVGTNGQAAIATRPASAPRSHSFGAASRSWPSSASLVGKSRPVLVLITDLAARA